ncbi:UDP-N-acetylmuramoyl-tripeptide--D-alanyl-D-alanine ligase [uncultured Ruminococcus sp.]|uniref:UDP-N-acetylmuramoyl-tripeptide--D-alanyl-D- alanine ligase n=1 Tax=uncultured Ruminococcus sp. TaxID=165186 RepID=UPI00267630F8|nr:UDP-N-acetylmuramoyl-tripeptide--D-alanyl-D-alanine ligase [uncultured Ruminococcus sp.]
MKPWKLSELEAVLHCAVPVEAEITCVSTDTRDLPAGCLFVALRGEKFDGHAFVEQAIAAGAVAAVTDRQVGDCPCLVVKDTGRALQQIARFYREKFHPILVGITGSVGKTTTKEMIACVLESQFCTLKTQGNLNNEIGQPKTLLGLENCHQAAVIEMGMSHFGEISRMARTAEPSIGVITNIGYSHIENLKTQEGIRQAKLEIQDGMAADAPLVVNGDDPLLAPLKRELSRPVITYGMHSEKADVRAADVERKAQSTSFSILAQDGSTYPVELPCAGDHNVMNALAAFCVGRLAGIAPEQICKALEQYHTVGLRQNIYRRGAYTIIADCYNASPDSMKAALTVLRDLPCKGRRIAVLGDMLELGEMSRQLHTLVGDMAAESEVDALFCYGKESFYLAQRAAMQEVAVYHTEDKRELCRVIRQYLRPNDVILFKASRGMHLEDCIDVIFEQEEDADHAVLD